MCPKLYFDASLYITNPSEPYGIVNTSAEPIFASIFKTTFKFLRRWNFTLLLVNCIIGLAILENPSMNLV